MAASHRKTRSTVSSRKHPAKSADGARKSAQRTAVNAPHLTPASGLPPIQCVVVLMLENRSFDHLFGK
jgi:phospholipase C